MQSNLLIVALVVFSIHISQQRVEALQGGIPRIHPTPSSHHGTSFLPSVQAPVPRSAVVSLLLVAPFLPNLPAVAAGLSEDYRQGTAALSGLDADGPVPREAYVKLPSGVVYADLRKGKGKTAATGSRVNLQWVLRKSNGYFVDSSERNDSVPFIFTIGDGSAIAGLDEAMVGVAEGGVRRVLIPPALAYVEGLEDGKPGPIPVGFGPRQQMRRVQNVRKDVPGEYVFLEVQVTKIR